MCLSPARLVYVLFDLYIIYFCITIKLKWYTIDDYDLVYYNVKAIKF